MVTVNWTKDRGKRITLNSGFIERILHKRGMGVEIKVVVSVRCSLCWVSKFNDFLTVLRQQAADCELGDLTNSLVKDVLIIFTNNLRHKERRLKEQDVT